MLVATEGDMEECDDAALVWAEQHVAFTEAKLLRDAPWAKTLRLHTGKGQAFLKCLPTSQSQRVKSAHLLSQSFPGVVPHVIASDANSGFLLTDDHGGRYMDYQSSESEMCRLLKSYGAMQVKSVGNEALLSSLQRVELDTILDRFLHFLHPEDSAASEASHRVSAEHFIGRNEANRYYRTLVDRRAMLKKHLEAIRPLPTTLNHCDLRPPNMAVLPDKSIMLCDWDDAIAGPAGLSLHGMFSGCSRITKILSDHKQASVRISSHHQARLEAYIHTLVKGGYADFGTLAEALPATSLAGVMQYLLSFADFPTSGRGKYRHSVGRSISRRLSDLLDLCDFLAIQDRATAVSCAQCYIASGQYRRAQHLLSDYQADQGDDSELQLQLAQASRKRGREEVAIEACKKSAELAPEDPRPHNELGEILLERLEFDDAITEFERALALDGAFTDASGNLTRATDLRDVQLAASEPGQVPRLAFTETEREAEAPRRDTLAIASSLFKKYGVLQLDNVFPVGMIEHLRDAFFERYTDYFRKDNHADALRVGDQRYMLTVDMEEPFSDPRLFAPSLVLPIFRKLLGRNCVIGAFTSVISLPGSVDQRLHKDHPALFPGTKWHHELPSFAVQMIVPLIPLDKNVGSTRMVKGSHLIDSKVAAEMDVQDPVVPLGSCLLNDYRVSHRGMGNRSKLVRPILTIVYNRPWFRDFANYGKQPPLRCNLGQLERMNKDHQRLFSWWQESQFV